MTAEGVSVIVDEANLLGSHWLVAMMVTVCGVLMFPGAEYRPVALMLPAPPGPIVQVTAVWLVFATFAVSCAVWPSSSVAVAGLTLTDMGGISVTVAVRAVDDSPRVVAVIVTVACELRLSGAV